MVKEKGRGCLSHRWQRCRPSPAHGGAGGAGATGAKDDDAFSTVRSPTCRVDQVPRARFPLRRGRSSISMRKPRAVRAATVSSAVA